MPLGEYPELTARGIPPTGTLNFGESIVTSVGLVFIGASGDEKFHAFDKGTGQILWEYSLPAGGYATPSTYMVDGRQFVVIAAGGACYIETPVGDSFVAFSLPGQHGQGLYAETQPHYERALEIREKTLATGTFHINSVYC